MLELRPHQKEAVDKLKNGSILYGGVGTGKSRAAVGYYMKREAPKNIYVITTAKKRDSLDWEKEFSSAGVGKERNATVAGILSIDSWNNLWRYRDVEGAFFIFDEQRLVGSGEWSKNFLKIAKKNRWILLSATPGDTWLDYIPVFVANGFYKNRTEFKREHVVYNTFSKFPKVDRYINVGKLIRLRNNILVEMKYQLHTIRNHVKIQVQYDKELFERVVKDRWHVYEERPLRDVAELFHVMRKVANSDLTRLSAVQSLMRSHPRLIVFYNFDYELEILRSLVDPIIIDEGDDVWPTLKLVDTTFSTSEFVKNSISTQTINQKLLSNVGVVEQNSLKNNSEGRLTNSITTTTSGFKLQIAEWNGHKHQPIPDTESWVYLVQYVAGAEGWNCIATDAVIFYSLPYSYKIWHQAHGRIDRLNTPFTVLHYYTLMSNSFIDRAIANSLAAKQSFNEIRFSNQMKTK